LYSLSWDIFSVVRCWTPTCTGPERERLFEQIFYRYCARKRLPLSEKAGSRTLDGSYSASGYLHESDGVIATPDVNVHVELKHLTQPVAKLDLVSFNQKGLDFLAGEGGAVRRKPLYRVLATASPAEETARVFAVQWGIVLIEPNRLPLLVIDGLARRSLAVNPRSLHERRFVSEVPSMIVPLQERVRRLASILSDHRPLMSVSRIRWMLDIQDGIGARLWRRLDEDDPTWIEDRYDGVMDETG